MAGRTDALLPRAFRPSPLRTTARRGRVRATLATLIALAGLTNLFSALLVRVGARLAHWPQLLPFEVLHGSRSFVVVAGFGLLLLARGLWHGRWVAWAAALALLLGSVVSHIGKGFNVGEATFHLALAAALVARRDDFRARPDTPTLRDALRTVALGLVGLALYSLAGMAILRERFRPVPTWGQLLREGAARLILSSTDELGGANFRARWFLDSISIVWVALLALAVVAVLRPVLRPSPEAPRDRADAASLFLAGGAQSIAAMTLWPGNTVLINGWRDAYVAYRVIGGVALALGDPVGARDGGQRAIEEFLDLCAARGWTPCFYAVTGRQLPALQALGFRQLQIAEDTIIDLAGMEFKGKAWQDVRTALNRAEKEGLRFELTTWAALDPARREQLAAISDAWAGEKGLPEMGFTLGTLAEAADPGVRLGLAIDAAGVVQGFTSWLPVAEDGRVVGWTIDLMRRRPDGFRSVMEYLIAQGALALRAAGAERISLSAAPLARIPREGQEATRLQRALDFLAERLEPYYGFRSLLAFKQKFKPRYEPLYLAFPGTGDLPRCTLAILRAYLPGLGLAEVADLVRGRE